MHNDTEDINKQYKNFDELILKLNSEKTNLTKKFETKGNQCEVILDNKIQDKKETEECLDESKLEKSSIKKLKEKADCDDKIDKLKVRQRLIQFSFKIFHKYDFSKVL